MNTNNVVPDSNLDAFIFKNFDDKHPIKYITNTGHSGLKVFFLCTIVLDVIDVNILIYIITRCYITMTIYFTEIKEYDCYILFFCSQTTSSEVCTGEKFDGGVRRRFGA